AVEHSYSRVESGEGEGAAGEMCSASAQCGGKPVHLCQRQQGEIAAAQWRGQLAVGSSVSDAGCAAQERQPAQYAVLPGIVDAAGRPECQRALELQRRLLRERVFLADEAADGKFAAADGSKEVFAGYDGEGCGER